ncbi:MAG: DUF349 domain-containing protein [Demequinaceae bacterium]|nr:DUF349 domain-containing protein [Demequinaceae bacterium]
MSTAKPGTSPRPKPPTPAALAARSKHPVKIPVVTDLDTKAIASASKFGEVEDGKVVLIDGDARHVLGPAEGDEPLLPFIRRYYDHVSGLERFFARLETSELTIRDIESGLKEAEAVLAAPDCVGSLAAFRKRLSVVSKKAIGLRDAIAAERETLRAAAEAEREALVVRAEEIAAKPIGAVHWKDDTAELRSLLDSWKEAQKSSTRIGKEAEHALWHRFAHARSTFEKTRKHHFAELEKRNAEVAETKEKLALRAEEIVSSTKWEETAREFRGLMSEWKAAGRGRKASDDELWKRFQTAQDAFFDARRAILETEKAVEDTNLEQKEAIVSEAEALLPVTDLSIVKTTLRSLQDRFEAVGKVSKADADLLHRRLAAVERAVREAQDEAWTARNPELEARVSGAAQQLISAIEDLDAQIEAAEAAGDQATVKELTESREARKAWLEQIQSSTG